MINFDLNEDAKNGEVTGLIILSGSVRAHAYAFARDPLTRAVTDLKVNLPIIRLSFSCMNNRNCEKTSQISRNVA